MTEIIRHDSPFVFILFICEISKKKNESCYRLLFEKKNSYNNDISHIADRYRVYGRSFLKL